MMIERERKDVLGGSIKRRVNKDPGANKEGKKCRTRVSSRLKCGALAVPRGSRDPPLSGCGSSFKCAEEERIAVTRGIDARGADHQATMRELDDGLAFCEAQRGVTRARVVEILPEQTLQQRSFDRAAFAAAQEREGFAAFRRLGSAMLDEMINPRRSVLSGRNFTPILTWVESVG